MTFSDSVRSRAIRITGAAAALAVSFLASATRADIVTQSSLPDVVLVAGTSSGSQAFADIGTPTTDSGNINTGTSFTIGNMISTGASLGYFAGLSTQILGPVTFSTASGTSLSFGNATLGTFTSTSITEQTNASGERSFYVLGSFSAGTFNPALSPNPAPASLILGFTQSPAGTGAISDSATLSIPPAAVPEPSTIVLATVGIAAAVATHRVRRRGSVRTAGSTQDRG
ncbi:MAG: PEP-CTERM sorting domain-containing protein [Planctomycetaceae bacterium]